MKKILLGILSGITLGLLFAPKKGKELRASLLKSEEKLGDFAKEVLAAAKEAGNEVQSLINGEEVRRILAKGKDHIADLLRQGEKLSEKGKKEFEEMIEKLKKGDSQMIKAVKSFLDEEEKKSKK
jgi:gas vesicle protein